MKTVPAETLARLAAPAATRATCWTVTRRDGAVFGFTDHDRPLVLDGVTHDPALGLTGGATTLEAGFAAGSAEVTGILGGPQLAEVDLAAGLWDGARVDIVLVDWDGEAGADGVAVVHRVLLRRAAIGEVSRAGGAFRAELRGLAHLLDVPQGRVFSHLCDADLGDARCRVDLVAGGFETTGTFAAGGLARRPALAGVPDLPAEWFAGGRLTVLDGTLAGLRAEIVSDRIEDGLRRLALAEPLAALPPPGTPVRLSAGCDKRFATCRDKFANALNFQGFPHMPGADHVLAYPSRGAAANDGGALVD